jgi:hypothetical protein
MKPECLGLPEHSQSAWLGRKNLYDRGSPRAVTRAELTHDRREIRPAIGRECPFTINDGNARVPGTLAQYGRIRRARPAMRHGIPTRHPYNSKSRNSCQGIQDGRIGPVGGRTMEVVWLLEFFAAHARKLRAKSLREATLPAARTTTSILLPSGSRTKRTIVGPDCYFRSQVPGLRHRFTAELERHLMKHDVTHARLRTPKAT